MKKLLLFLSIFFTYAYGNMSNYQLLGQWKVTASDPATEVMNITQAQLDSLIGEILVIGSESISLKSSVLEESDRSCLINPDTSGWIKTDPITYFHTNYNFPFEASDSQTLGFKTPFWTLDSNCIPVFTTKNPNQIVFLFAGVFLKADKVPNL